MTQTLPPLGFQCVKVIALPVINPLRADRFYQEQLGLEPAFEGTQQIGWRLDQVILMLKPDWAMPTDEPNPRVTISVENAPATQAALRARDIVISDEVALYDGHFLIGSFLDSEGNKLWFCSPADATTS